MLPPFTSLLNRAVLSCILIAIDSMFFIASYSILCALKISVNWIVWIFGYLIIIASIALCYSVSDNTYSLRNMSYGNLLGAFSFLITVYAASHWVSRRWYVFIKQRALSFFVQRSRTFFLFVRKHHTFFGWIVAAAAGAHMAVYLPMLFYAQRYEIITGFIAIGILALSVLLGVWIWFVTSIRKQRPPRLVHRVHSLLTIAFLLALAAHI